MTRRLKHEWQNILRKKCKKYLQSLKKCIQRVWVLHTSALMNWLTKRLILALVYNVLHVLTMGNTFEIQDQNTKFYKNPRFCFNPWFSNLLKNILEKNNQKN